MRNVLPIIAVTIGVLTSGCSDDGPSRAAVPDHGTGGENLDGGNMTGGAGGSGAGGFATGGSGAAITDGGPPPAVDTRSCFARCTADSDCSGCPVAATCTNGLCGLACTSGAVASQDVTLTIGSSNPENVAKVLGATEIIGNLIIVGDDRRNLRILQCLEQVVGDVSIGFAQPFCPPGFGFTCPPPPLLQLTSLIGLERLTSITGSLVIDDNSVLGSLDGLSGLTNVLDVTISRNPRITSLPFVNLTRVEGGVYITANPALQSLSGLDHLTFVGANFTVEGEPLVKDMTGLGALGEIGGDLHMSSDYGLESFAGLEALRRIGGTLQIEDARALTTLAPLSGVTFIGNSAVFSDVPKLTSVDGFPKTPTLGGDLNITHADALTNVRGFASLKGANSVSLISVPQLTSLAGFEGLAATSRIAISDAPLVTSLAPFSGVRGATDISIYDVGMPDLTGLEGITSSAIDIAENAELTSLTGLGSVTTSTMLSLRANPKLASIAALSKLASVQGVSIVDNAALTSLTGLDALTTVTGNIEITGSPLVSTLAPFSGLTGSVSTFFVSRVGLTDLHGLEGLQRVDDTLGIGISSSDLSDRGTTKLASLKGLENLVTVGALVLAKNAALVDLSALANLNVVSYGLSIHGNATLRKLTGLSGLTSVGGELAIYDNALLPQCEAIVLANRLGMTCGPTEVTCLDVCTCPGNNGTTTCP